MPTVSLSLGKRSYDVLVANGLLESVGYHVNRLRLEGKAALISDSNVYPLYGEQVKQSIEDAGFAVSTHVFPAGEQSKNLQTVEMLADEMIAAGHDRSSFVIWPDSWPPSTTAAFLLCRYPRA